MDTVLPADDAPVMPARAAPTQAAPQPEREFFEEPAEGLNGALVVTGGPPPTPPARPLRRFLTPLQRHPGSDRPELPR